MDKLSEFRRRVNSLDENLLDLLGERFDICREVARYKRAERIPMMQSARVQEVKERCAQLGVKRRLDPGFVLWDSNDKAWPVLEFDQAVRLRHSST